MRSSGVQINIILIPTQVFEMSDNNHGQSYLWLFFRVVPKVFKPVMCLESLKILRILKILKI